MELDKLIERAARGSTSRDRANKLAQEWARSEAVHREKMRQENRELWLDFHLGQAARLRKTMEILIARHEEAVAQLLEEPGDATR
jgi:hypothetical protein